MRSLEITSYKARVLQETAARGKQRATGDESGTFAEPLPSQLSSSSLLSSASSSASEGGVIERAVCWDLEQRGDVGETALHLALLLLLLLLLLPGAAPGESIPLYRAASLFINLTYLLTSFSLMRRRRNLAVRRYTWRCCCIADPVLPVVSYRTTPGAAAEQAARQVPADRRRSARCLPATQPRLLRRRRVLRYCRLISREFSLGVLGSPRLLVTRAAPDSFA